MPEVTPELNNLSVRKWPVQKLCLADEDATVPTELIGGDKTPIAVPSGYYDLGYITTDGVASTDSLSSENSNMLQTLVPVRSDLTGREQTLSVTFGERNAWTKALVAGLRCTDWPVDKYGPTDFTQGVDISDFPYFRALLFKMDGIGAKAVYGVEQLFRVKPTSVTDRTRSRSAEDTIGVTLTLFPDPVHGTRREAEDGPGIGSGSTIPVITDISPADQVPGDLVTITGYHIGTATGITFDGIAVDDFEVVSASKVVAIIPDTLTGPVTASVELTTPAGTSQPFAYDVA